jgi:hypothetical protein
MGKVVTDQSKSLGFHVALRLLRGPEQGLLRKAQVDLYLQQGTYFIFSLSFHRLIWQA